MIAIPKTRPQNTTDEKAGGLACRRCGRELVAIYGMRVGNQQVAVLPDVQDSVLHVLGRVTSFKCPTCHHSTIAPIQVP